MEGEGTLSSRPPLLSLKRGLLLNPLCQHCLSGVSMKLVNRSGLLRVVSGPCGIISLAPLANPRGENLS